MKAPTQIKRALKCLAGEWEEHMCTSCVYRKAQDCRREAMQDVQAYIALLEKGAAKTRTGREGRVRTVYLYTIKNQSGETVCKDATVREAMQAMGYEEPSAILYMLKKYESGKAQGYTITRRKGIVGEQLLPEERTPYFVYKVTGRDGTEIARNINRKDLAVFLGMTIKGVQSMFHAARKRGQGDRVEYKSYIIECKRTARGEKYYPQEAKNEQGDPDWAAGG